MKSVSKTFAIQVPHPFPYSGGYGEVEYKKRFDSMTLNLSNMGALRFGIEFKAYNVRGYAFISYHFNILFFNSLPLFQE